MADLICPIKELDLLNDQDFKDATEGLSPTVVEGTPFMISYDLFITHKDVECSPHCYAWTLNKGKVNAVLLDKYQPDLVHLVGAQMFSLLTFNDLRFACGDELRRMISTHGETYHCCASPHGVILVADGVQIVQRNHGERSCFSGFMPTGLSNHHALAHMNNLQKCAEALLSEQLHYCPEDAPNWSVKISRA
jgi:hypothetical protein